MNSTQDMRSLDASEIEMVAGGEPSFWEWIVGDAWETRGELVLDPAG